MPTFANFCQLLPIFTSFYQHLENVPIAQKPEPEQEFLGSQQGSPHHLSMDDVDVEVDVDVQSINQSMLMLVMMLTLMLMLMLTLTLVLTMVTDGDFNLCLTPHLLRDVLQGQQPHSVKYIENRC